MNAERRTPNAELVVRGVRKSFGAEQVLRGVDCDVEAQQTLSVLGQSGSGKTTLLRIIAGLETPDAGRITLDGRDLAGMRPGERSVVYLYQEPLLFPHLSVRENIAFGVRVQSDRTSDVEQRVGAMIEHLGLDGHADKAPRQLSGGQKQRVAFGRAIIVNPTLLLLDEPFANLDVEIRGQMQRLFKRLAREYAITSLFVTHNLKEAILMGDRYAHLQQGTLRAYDSRQAFVDDPAVGVRDEMAFWTTLDRNVAG